MKEKHEEKAAHDGSFLLQGTSKWHCQNGGSKRGEASAEVRWGKFSVRVFFFFSPKRPVIVSKIHRGLSRKMAGNLSPMHSLGLSSVVRLKKKTNKKKHKTTLLFSPTSLSFLSSSDVKDVLTKWHSFWEMLLMCFLVRVVLANASAMCQKSSMEPLLSQATFSLP